MKQSLLNFLSILKMPFISEEHLRLKFHKNFSSRFNNKAVFSFSSARASLSACLKSIGIKGGDEVLYSF